MHITQALTFPCTLRNTESFCLTWLACVRSSWIFFFLQYLNLITGAKSDCVQSVWSYRHLLPLHADRGGAAALCADSSLVCGYLRKPDRAEVFFWKYLFLWGARFFFCYLHRCKRPVNGSQHPLTFADLPFQRVLFEVNTVHVYMCFTSGVYSPDYTFSEAGAPAVRPALLRQQRQYRCDQPGDELRRDPLHCPAPPGPTHTDRPTDRQTDRQADRETDSVGIGNSQYGSSSSYETLTIRLASTRS